MGAVSRLVDEVLTRNGTATRRRVEPEELEVCSRTKIPMLIDESVSDKLPKRDGAFQACLLYTSPSPRDKRQSRMPSSA